MAEYLFISPVDWMDDVHRVLAQPGIRRELDARRLAPETVLTVALFEAQSVAKDGNSTLTHERLAELAGIPLSAVLRARLFLVERGLQSLTSRSCMSVGVHRVLHRA